MRANRLLSMMLLLQKHKHMTAQDLAKQLEVSERTIYRDVDALSLAGIPVFSQPGTNGGIFLDENYGSTLTGLSNDQVLSLFATPEAGPLADIGMDQAVKESLLKLFHTLPSSQQTEVEWLHQRFYIDPVGWFNFGNISQYLSMIQQAVWQDKQVKMVYQAYGKAPSPLIVDAYALVSKADKWYLVGRKTSGDYRTYVLTHLLDLEILENTFRRDNAFNLIEYWQAAQFSFQQQMAEEFPPYNVLLNIHMGVFWYLSVALEGRFEQLTPPDKNKWCQVKIQFSTEYEAQAHILAMGTHVKIITPQNLRDKMSLYLAKITHHYRQS